MLLWSHRALGLGLGLLLMLQAAGGLALIYREELLVALSPQLLALPSSTSVPAVGRVLQEIDQRFDRPPIERLVFPRGKRTAVMVYLHDEGVARRRVIASDPVSGAVIGEVNGIGLMPFVLLRLHEELLLGNSGRVLLIIEGVGLLYLLAAGFLLGRPLIHGRLRLRWRGTKLARRFDLHRTLGLSSALFLTISAATGITMQVKSLTDAPASPLAPRVATSWALLMPHIVRIIHDYGPQAIEDIRFSEDGRTAKFLVYTNEIRRPLALDRISVDLISGDVSLLRRAADESAGSGTLAWMYPLHTGKALGAAGALIALATALALLLMPLFGFLLWRAKPARMRRVNRIKPIA